MGYVCMHVARRVAVSDCSSAVEDAERSCRYYALDNTPVQTVELIARTASITITSTYRILKVN